MGKATTPLEETAAQALLLIFTTFSSRLSTGPSSSSSSKQFSRSEKSVFAKPEASSSVSDSSSSVITSEALYSNGDSEIQASKLDFLFMVASAHGTIPNCAPKRRSVRAPRSQISRRKSVYGGWSTAFWPPSMSEEVSTLQSSSSSSVSYVGREIHGGRRSFKPTLDKKILVRKYKREAGAILHSTRTRRLAEAILKFLSVGSASEIKIRNAVGNSPDTSKALRMLLRLEEVTRSGVGGRSDPFLYTVVGHCTDVDCI